MERNKGSKGQNTRTKGFFFLKETEILYFPLKYLSTCGCHGVYKEFQLRRNILGLSKEDFAVSLKRN